MEQHFTEKELEFMSITLMKARLGQMAVNPELEALQEKVLMYLMAVREENALRQD